MKSSAKKKLVHIALICALLLVFLPQRPAKAAVTVNPTIRVGLYYGSNTLPGANLLNSVGNGYRLGYFDEGRNFVHLAETAESGISIVKTQNVYYGKVDKWSGYYDTITSPIMVGCFHLQLPGSYQNFAAAQAAASAFPGGFVAWVDGTYYVRVGSYGSGEEARSAQARPGLTDTTVVGTSGSGVSVVATGTDRILFQFDSTRGLALGVMPGLDGSVKTKTIFRGNLYYGGFQYQRLSGGNLTVSNVLPMEDYIQGVVIREMSPSWPLEALKAQAVCARTYAYRSLNAAKHRSQGFDICNTVHCQAYSGISGMSETSRQAVEGTRGLYVWYGNSLADTTYFSSDGGATEDAVNVWGNETPHLKGKIDPYEATIEGKIPQYRWKVSFTNQELTNILNKKGYTNSGIVDFKVTKRTPTGNVAEITFVDASGKRYTKIRESCRTLLGLKSMRFDVTPIGGGTGGSAGFAVTGGGTLPSMDGVYAVGGDGTPVRLPGGALPYVVTGSGSAQLTNSVPSRGSGFEINGIGWGHNVGMSQWGAYAMAKSGHSFRDILTFYYTGIEVREP